jgi:hypothetical protein
VPDPDAANADRRPELADPEPPPTRSTQDGKRAVAPPPSPYDLATRPGEQAILAAGNALGQPVSFVNAVALLGSKTAQRLGIASALQLLDGFGFLLRQDDGQPYRRLYAGSHCAAILGDEWTPHDLERLVRICDYDARAIVRQIYRAEHGLPNDGPPRPGMVMIHEAEIDIQDARSGIRSAIETTARAVHGGMPAGQIGRSRTANNPNEALLEMAVRSE